MESDGDVKLVCVTTITDEGWFVNTKIHYEVVVGDVVGEWATESGSLESIIDTYKTEVNK
jgi:hypothetical protein